jgi:hypothetical protein
VTGGIVFGLVVGSVGGYAAGRMHKAYEHWRHDVAKLRSDRKSLRRGPKW